MTEAEAEVLKVGDYLVIVVYFVFVLLVGLWVSLLIKKLHIINIYYVGIMEIKEEQCWRLLLSISKHALDSGKKSQL